MLNIISQDQGVNFAKKIADQVLHDSIRTEFDKQLLSYQIGWGKKPKDINCYSNDGIKYRRALETI